jgi:hypothetical protein
MSIANFGFFVYRRRRNFMPPPVREFLQALKQ